MEKQEEKRKIKFICVSKGTEPSTSTFNSFANRLNGWGNLELDS